MKPIDLNNLFIASTQANELISQAEAEGFSHNICAWIKGIYSSVINNGIKDVIAVTGGDCSNTIALGELLESERVRVIPFEYPLNRDRDSLTLQIDKLRESLSTTWPKIEAAKERLKTIRNKLKILDVLTYKENLVSGLENHLYLVSSSDFNSDPDKFEKNLDLFLAEAQERRPVKDVIRLGYLGVPPIFSGFYELIESLGARVVFNEVQRQFSIPFTDKNLVDQYLAYTYPYDVGGRIRDVKEAVYERGIDGLIHYTQTFCYRQIYDIILRKSLPVPILTLEGDRPGKIDGRTAFRIETFIEILKDRKGA